MTPLVFLTFLALGGMFGVYTLKAKTLGPPSGSTFKRVSAEKRKTPMGKWASFDNSTVIDNQAVMTLAQTKLSARTMVKVIERSPCRFDVSPKAMIRMKESGVPEEVIYAMLANLDQCDSEPGPTAMPTQIQDKVAASIATELVAPVQ